MNSMKVALATTALVGTALCASSQAHAQDVLPPAGGNGDGEVSGFGEGEVDSGDDYGLGSGPVGFAAPGAWVISADRLFGFHSWTRTTSPDGGEDIKQSATQFSLLMGAVETGVPATIPRLAFDYVLGPGGTLGAFVGFYTSSTEMEIAGNKADGPTITAFAIGPRVGYFAALSPLMGIWPRAGFTFYSLSAEEDEDTPAGGTETLETTTTLQNVNLEVMLAISPTDSFAFLIGPAVDIGVGGSIEADAGGQTAETDLSYTSFGLAAGIGGSF